MALKNCDMKIKKLIEYKQQIELLEAIQNGLFEEASRVLGISGDTLVEDYLVDYLYNGASLEDFKKVYDKKVLSNRAINAFRDELGRFRAASEDF
jgi:hypothetical protein